MRKLKFPYRLQLREEGEIIPLPLVPARFFSNKESVEFLLLLDSGAEISLLTKEDAELLGINLEKGERVKLRGIGGSIDGFKHLVKMVIGEIKLKAPAVFANVDSRVLGREEVFDKFFILFDEEVKQTIFIRRNLESQKELKKIFNNGS